MLCANSGQPYDSFPDALNACDQMLDCESIRDYGGNSLLYGLCIIPTRRETGVTDCMYTKGKNIILLYIMKRFIYISYN